jgi:hypothetical protein
LERDKSGTRTRNASGQASLKVGKEEKEREEQTIAFGVVPGDIGGRVFSGHFLSLCPVCGRGGDCYRQAFMAGTHGEMEWNGD